MAITWTKLKSGAYGIRSTEPIEAGVPVTVEKKSGETSEAVVERILWTGADRATGEQVWLASVVQRQNSAARPSYPARASSDGAKTHEEKVSRYIQRVAENGGMHDDDIPF